MAYTIMRGILEHSADVFTDDVVHLGFDEVFESCWDTSAKLQTWMAEQGIPDYKALKQYHLDRVMAIVRPLGRQPIFWQEAFDYVRSGAGSDEAGGRAGRDGARAGERNPEERSATLKKGAQHHK